MKVAVLAEQNFNLIDGSTIWLLNVCKILALQDDFETDLLLTHKLENRVLAQELPDAIKVKGAEQLLQAAALEDTQLRAGTLRAVLGAWEAEHGPYDRIFVRGTGYLTTLLEEPGVRGRIVACAPGTIPELGRAEPDWVRLARLARVPVVVQSETARHAMESLCDYPAHTLHVVPPIMFRTDAPRRDPAQPVTLCYSGKVDLHYGFDWLLDICNAVGTVRGLAVSLIAGKDTCRGRHPDFFNRMDRLRVQASNGDLPQVSIVSNVGHGEAKALMGQADFAYCLRHDRYDDVIEISTKIVEFCTLDVPPILNDNALNRAMFGEDYPYYIDIAQGDVPARVVEILQTRMTPTYRAAQARIGQIAKTFCAQALASHLATAIRGWALPAGPLADHPRKILISTHDRKFLSHFTDRLKRDPHIGVSWESWASSNRPSGPPGVPDGIDTVFCEWCCENAVWHSANKRPGTRLIVRLHRFEAFRDFPERVQWHNVDALIVVSDWFRDHMVAQYGLDPAIIHVIPQYIDWKGLRRPKLPEAQFTLGLVGINPFEHKRLDRAIAFLAALIARDDRFKLAVRSSMPWEIKWVWDRDDGSRAQFEAIFERIFGDPVLSRAVRFDPPGPDMEEWYRGVGTILSSSDNEGCHTSVLEGMASGCLPVVHDWPGARSLFAPYVHAEMTEAIPEVIAFARTGVAGPERDAISDRVRDLDYEAFTRRFMAL